MMTRALSVDQHVFRAISALMVSALYRSVTLDLASNCYYFARFRSFFSYIREFAGRPRYILKYQVISMSRAASGKTLANWW